MAMPSFAYSALLKDVRSKMDPPASKNRSRSSLISRLVQVERSMS